MKTKLLLLLLLTGMLAAVPVTTVVAEEPAETAATADSSSADSTSADSTSVFEKLAVDPNQKRYGQAAGDGWIPMTGTKTELRVSGFAQLNIIHDFQDAGYPYGDFIPALIPVPTDQTTNTEFDVRTSRLVFETRSRTEEVGSVRTMISMDFAGQPSAGSIQPRLRQAYVGWVGPSTNIAFTAGQAWTTYLDLAVWPDIFDLEGPNAMTGTRQGLVRGSYAFRADQSLIFDLALEQPESAVANGVGLRDLPDLVARLNWQRGWGHLQGAALGRQLMAESNSGGGKDSALGWGLSLSGSWLIPGTKHQKALSDDLGARQDKLQFQVQGGSGPGRYVFDPGGAPTPQDAVYEDATATLTPLDEFGAFGAYHHWWSDRWRSQIVYGWVSMGTLEIQPSTAFDNSTYVLVNLVYRFFRRMDVGLEYYRGERENKGGESGHANRLLLGVNFGF